MQLDQSDEEIATLFTELRAKASDREGLLVAPVPCMRGNASWHRSASDARQNYQDRETSVKDNCARSPRYFSAAVIIGFALAIPMAAMADLITLNLPGITGDVTVEKQQGTIEVLSLSGNIATGSGGGSGANSGPPVFSDLIIHKRLDRSSPALFLALVQHQLFSSGVITFLHETGDGFIKFFTIKLQDVFVTKFATDDSENQVLAGNEQINLAYRTIQLKDTVTGESACWDVLASRRC